MPVRQKRLINFVQPLKTLVKQDSQSFTGEGTHSSTLHSLCGSRIINTSSDHCEYFLEYIVKYREVSLKYWGHIFHSLSVFPLNRVMGSDEKLCDSLKAEMEKETFELDSSLSCELLIIHSNQIILIICSFTERYTRSIN